MSVRSSRTRLVTAAASLVVGAFSVTGCLDSGSGVIETATGPSLRAAAPTAAAAAPSAEPTASAGPGGTGGPGGNAGTPAPKAPAPAAPAAAKPATCEGSTTRTTAAPLNRPANHLLLTVTNTGSGTCYLYGYPAVRFGEAQSVPPVIEDSKPQAVVTLKPGESGYASVNLSSTDGTGASNGRTATSLTVHFHGPSGNESVGTGAHPPLPARGTYVDDSLKVTYWQQDLADAVTW
ncbi:DUF4232 domain-containing protein [Streptomyces sp. CBMA156]|uniref:DUF4232 domain-containing protein n=1 Tax=Streptomyces sp. CBMA156 TaxID=1930280 RepID=UPI001661E018|nr:DUF4232 domain-containing protein [Streptomyces sp. CBMA156]MBD0672934.1 hypothetical protein [Streptomyces sp. CBMA156]